MPRIGLAKLVHPFRDGNLMMDCWLWLDLELSKSIKSLTNMNMKDLTELDYLMTCLSRNEWWSSENLFSLIRRNIVNGWARI